MNFKVTIDQKVDASKGGFEVHPESYSPRVFAAVIPTKGRLAVYEILMTGDAITWGENYPDVTRVGSFWFFTVNSLSDMNMFRPPYNPQPYSRIPAIPAFGGMAGGGGAPRQLRTAPAPVNYRLKCIEWLRSNGGGAALNIIVEEGYDGDGCDYKSLYEKWTAPMDQADGCACNEGE